MMNTGESCVLITGGAGFIGRWLVAELLDRGHQVRVLDNLSSGTAENLAEFNEHPGFQGLTIGDVTNPAHVREVFDADVGLCCHLAAKINVQQSIDTPHAVVENDIIGTFHVLETARAQAGAAPRPIGNRPVRTTPPKVVFVSTCMVYAPATSSPGIDETHPVQALSPYAACKLAGEQLALSYHHAYGLPVTVLRPFNTYGPGQRTDTEGGVVAVFLQRANAGEPLLIRGDGRQTRDLLYVKDCARFIAEAGLNPLADGRVLNAGSGVDVSINDLAAKIARGHCAPRHVPHNHPQAEIACLRCDYSEAARVLGWRPHYDLAQGLEETETWVRSHALEPVPA